MYGWGQTSQGGALSSVLLEVNLPVVTPEQCTAAMGLDFHWFPAKDGELCAGGVGGEDSCGVSGHWPQKSYFLSHSGVLPVLLVKKSTS